MDKVVISIIILNMSRCSDCPHPWIPEHGSMVDRLVGEIWIPSRHIHSALGVSQAWS